MVDPFGFNCFLENSPPKFEIFQNMCYNNSTKSERDFTIVDWQLNKIIKNSVQTRCNVEAEACLIVGLR